METIQMLGSLGEFVGAIAVVATLVYLAIQVRHSKEAMEANTRSVDESRNLALAQTYQARAAVAEEAFRAQANSAYLPSIILKYGEGGRDALTPEEQYRLSRMHAGLRTRLDNLYYQYQMGLLDEQYYEASVVNVIRINAPTWADIGLSGARRPPFRAEIEPILSESEAEAEEQS